MMRIAIRVEYLDGGEQKFLISAPDVIAFERQYDMPWTAMTSGRQEYIWWATWSAAKRQKLVDAEFEQWLETVGDIGTDEGVVEEIVPLVPSPRTGTSVMLPMNTA
jgi:hypothetical protein